MSPANWLNAIVQQVTSPLLNVRRWHASGSLEQTALYSLETGLNFTS
jgi:hypothetical protein